MTDHTIDISCDGPTPGTIHVTHGDKVYFSNSTGAAVTIHVDNPAVFNPQPNGTFTVASGQSKRQVVGDIGNGTGYEYPDCGEALGTRNGRIDP